jgi:hypothetical protein
VVDKFELTDSGEREQFATGSQRDTRENKGRFDLISPIALIRLARVYEKGAEKYDDRNWERGQPISRYLDSAIRHLVCYQLGMRDEDHLGQAAWNAFAAMHTEEVGAAELNDLPIYLTEFL